MSKPAHRTLLLVVLVAISILWLSAPATAQQCQVLLNGSFPLGTTMLSPRPNIPTDVPSDCSTCGSPYTCTEGQNSQQTPNQYSSHLIEAAATNRCIQVSLTSDCAGGGVGNTNLASGAWLAPFNPAGNKCDSNKLGTVCSNSPWPASPGVYRFALPAESAAEVVVYKVKNVGACSGYSILVESCSCEALGELPVCGVPVELEAFSIER